jgi:hypothetical protein
MVGHTGLNPRCSSLEVPLGLRTLFTHCRSLRGESSPRREGRDALRYDHWVRFSCGDGVGLQHGYLGVRNG